MGPVHPITEAEAHRQVLERRTAYVKGLPTGLFADDAMCRTALRLCMALVEQVHAAHESRQ